MRERERKTNSPNMKRSRGEEWKEELKERERKNPHKYSSIQNGWH